MDWKWWLRRLSNVLLLISIFLPVTAPANPLQAAAIPVAGFWQLVAESREQLDNLASLPVEVQRERLASMAGQWKNISEVILADGQVVAIEPAFLVAQLETDPPDVASLQELFASLAESRQRWPTPQHDAADTWLLHPILAQMEFQWPAQQRSLWQEWRQWLWLRLLEFLGRLFPQSIPSGGPWLGYILTAAGVLAVLLVLGYTLRGLFSDLINEAEIDLTDMANEENLTADTTLKRARQLSTGGDYRTAVRYLYLSSLLLLEERGLLRYDRSQTNREYLRSVAHLPELATTLREIIDVFDRVWYGYQPLDEAAYTHYAGRIDRLRRLERLSR